MAGINELESQVQALSEGKEITCEVYPKQIAYNVIPQVDVFQEGGYTKEEWKMVKEGRKILDLPELQVTCTCVRVPVYRSHSVSLSAQFEKPVSVEAAQQAYTDAYRGIRLCDDLEKAFSPLHLTPR